MLETGSPEAMPYVTPVSRPVPATPIETIPTAADNKPYVTPVEQPEAPAQGDGVPSQSRKVEP